MYYYKKHYLQKILQMYKKKPRNKKIDVASITINYGISKYLKKTEKFNFYNRSFRIALHQKKSIYYLFELFIELICYILSIKLNILIKKYIFYLEDSTVDSNYLSKYIAIKLLQKYTIRKIFNVIFGYMMSSRLDVAGLKICCSGRITKKQRATYFWEQKGSVKLNTFSSATDYSFHTIPMKFGAVGIKVWVGYKQGREIEDINIKDLKYCKDI